MYVGMIHGRATEPLIKTIKGWGQVCLSRFHLVCSNRVFSALLQRSKSWIKCWNTLAKYNKIGKRQILKKKSAAIQFSLVLSCATIHKHMWHEKTMRTDVFFSCTVVWSDYKFYMQMLFFFCTRIFVSNLKQVPI